MPETITTKGTWSGPRWAGMSNFVKNLAFQLDLQISIDVDKHFLTEDARFSVTGDKHAVAKFESYFNQAINAYNKR